MKRAITQFAGLVLLGVLFVGVPLSSGKDNDSHKICRDKDGDHDDRGCGAVPAPDSHGGPLLLLTAGILGAAMLIQRRRRIAS
jgi:MYXO-CTERM domain-containing protein